MIQLLVLCLVFGMGSPQYRVRERCQKALTRINNEWDLRGLMSNYMSHPDQEVRERLEKIGAAYETLCIDDDAPRLDSLFLDVKDSWAYNQASVGLCEDFVGHEYLGWPCYEDSEHRSATARFVLYLIRSGRSRKYVLQIIEAGKKFELERGIVRPYPGNFGG